MDIQELSNIILNCCPVTHKEKGYHYQVMSIVKSKHKDTDEWYEAVIYRQLESGEFFSRSIESFIENFVKVVYPCGIEIQTIKIIKKNKIMNDYIKTLIEANRDAGSYGHIDVK